MSDTAKRFPENLPSAWREVLSFEKDRPYFQKLTQFLIAEHRSQQTVYPASENILRALQLVDLPDVKVVILGQDPYHGAGQAIGLSFAVPNELRPKPPSLQNIFKEIESDLGVRLNPNESDLSGWVSQGVLLLNSVLTVRAHQAFSHRDQGWETFTDRVIECLGEREEPIVFLLWGAAAQKKKELLKSKKHFTLESPHPSPLSAHRGFLGCRHFSKTNQILEKIGKRPIDWTKITTR